MAIERLFQLMKEKEASDMFLAINSPICLKINGEIIPINQQRMDQVSILALLAEVVPAAKLDELDKTHELNMGIPVPGVGRFRLSAFRQRSNISAVIRFIPHVVPPLDSLHLPEVIGELITHKHGLLLVVGATGSGKSTTIAAMLDHRNANRTGHILTLEDPIEFQFTNKKSIVNQREIGNDAHDMATALRNALRQAPDVIFIGEIRDRDTMASALSYAQSGHLVVATLHANNSYQALTRIINFFPIEVRGSLLPDLAAMLRAIISQRLVKTRQGRRRAAVEVMLNSKHIAELIEKGEIGSIKEAIEKSLSAGSQTFEQALLQLLEEGAITQDEALTHADSITNLYWLINNQGKKDAAPADEDKPDQGPTFTEFTLNA
jgi:twitching motility protein PilU